MTLPPESDPPLVVEDVSFPAGVYQLQGELAYPAEGSPIGVGVLAGPHPLLGGNLHNNVVRGLGDGLAERGWATLRFNYRGVGRSQGPPVDVIRHLAQFWQTSHVPEEMDSWHDVQGAVDFLRQIAGPDLPVALVGYSFGCALLPHVRLEAPSAVLVLIAPTLGKHAYDSYQAVHHPILVITSADDFATEAGAVERWWAQLSMPRRLIQERFDNHFFRGYEGWLAQTVFACLRHPGG
jgi:alpha/beta superfamily hydrolase